MSNCEKFEEMILSGEWQTLSPAEDEALSHHIKDCPACREFLKLHGQLQSSAFRLPLPGGDSFFSMRRRVLAAIPQAEKPGRSIWPGYPLIWQFAAASVLLISAFLLGRFSTSSLQNNFDSGLISDNSAEFSNVRVTPLNRNRVELTFDLTRTVSLTRPEADPDVSAILVNSLHQDDTIAERLALIAQSIRIKNQSFKKVLIQLLEVDSHPVIRLRALQALGYFEADSQVTNTLLKIVSTDANISMRLTALDILITQQFAADSLQQLINQETLPFQAALQQKILPYVELSNTQKQTNH